MNHTATRLVAAGVLALGLAGGASVAGHDIASAHSVASHSNKTPMWLVADAKKHTATLTLIAGYNNTVGGGFNFNGYYKGSLIVTIPTGYKVNVVFSNNAPLPHSVLFTSFAKKDASTYTAAFKGAYSPKPMQGIGKGTTQKFSFVATNAGTYAMVCAVPGHEPAGMWDTFKVVKGGKASLTIKK